MLRTMSALSFGPPGSGLSHGGADCCLEDFPLDELLLDLHVRRFTGHLQVGRPDGADDIFFQGGVVVGMRVRPRVDRLLLYQVLIQLHLCDEAELAVLARARPSDGVEVCRVLIERGLVTPEDVGRAVETQARRRLVQLYELDPTEPLVVNNGLDALSHFHPIHLDIRPTIAFGFVMRAGPERTRALLSRLAGRRVRILVPYDEHRNSYGLPPPVMAALRPLAEGVELEDEAPHLPGLSPAESAGVLLLFERMRLLKVEA